MIRDSCRKHRSRDGAGGRGVMLSDETYLPRRGERALRTQGIRRQRPDASADRTDEPEQFSVLNAVAYRLPYGEPWLRRRVGVLSDSQRHDHHPLRAPLGIRREACSDRRESHSDRPPAVRIHPGVATPVRPTRRSRRAMSGQEGEAGR